MAVAGSTVTAAMVMTPQLDPVELECLAKNIYFEARGEQVEGQIAVAQVTINRVNHSKWPSTICDVVYQPKQFSWTHAIKDQTPRDKKSYAIAEVIARDGMLGNIKDPTDGAVFYHAASVNPYWTKYLTLSKVIGDHLFYTWDGDWNPDNN